MEFMKEMDDNSVDLVLSDPPYNFKQEQKEAVHKELLRVCKGTIIVFSPPENQWILPADQYCFWVKPISTKNTSKKYSRFVEMVFIYREGYFNNTWHWSQYPNVFTDTVVENPHPFCKPQSLIDRLVRNHTKEGDIVFDPFFGSATTAISCYDNNRDFVGCELNEDYYFMGLQRLENAQRRRNGSSY
jgi:DNA modification methylase